MPLTLLRYGIHFLFVTALTIGAVAAWATLDALDGKTDELVRHARVDAWTTQQTEVRSYQFLLAVSEYVAGNEAISLDDLHKYLRELKGTAAFLNLEELSPDVQAMPGKQDLRAEFSNALKEIEILLIGGAKRRGDIDFLLNIEAILSPWLTDLQRLMLNLTHIRLELQKRDLANAARLISVNRYLLIAIVGLGAVFLTIVSIEARAARRAEATARLDRGRFQDFAETASDWLWETDPDLIVTFVSDQIEGFSGKPAPHYIGLSLHQFVTELNGEQEAPSIETMISGYQGFRNCLLGSVDGQRFMRISGNAVHDDASKFLGFRGSCSDISSEVRREERIRFLAEHDHLTGLANRSFLQKQLRLMLEGMQAGRDGRGKLLVLDLDGFKDINDTFGHDVGDNLLIGIAERLSNELRSTDVVARLGGDEFAIIQVYANEIKKIDPTLADRLLAVIKQPLKVAGFEFTVGTSIGMASFPKDGTSVETLMKAADLALYKAKAAKGDCAVAYHQDMSLRLKRRRRLEQDLGVALEHGDLQLNMQPQVDFTSQSMIGGEVLLRWQHPEFGNISPDVFVPIAEETGLILPLGRWVLEHACRAAQQYGTGLGNCLVAVNISPAQFIHQDLVKEITDVLDRTGLPPGNLELEITEGLLMRDQPLAVDTLNQLNDIAIKLAIDDFGTGYSSLSYLKRFRVHKVKIDKAFVHDLEHDQGDHTIVRAVVMMSQAFGFQTIAEGVETEAQRDRLIALGCDQAQGYLYGKPQPIDQFFQNYVNARAWTATANRPAITAI